MTRKHFVLAMAISPPVPLDERKEKRIFRESAIVIASEHNVRARQPTGKEFLMILALYTVDCFGYRLAMTIRILSC